MNFIDQLTLTKKFFVQNVVFIAAMLVFFFWTNRTLQVIEVNGPLYRQIIAGKDLIADVLPPPAYIIESHLTVLEILRASNDAVRNEKIKKLHDLKRDYDERHKGWSEQQLESDLRNAFLVQAHEPVVTFYKIAFDEFVPAIQSGDSDKADTSVKRMEAAYLSHRSAIDQVVTIAVKQHTAIEASARAEIASGYMAIIIALLGCLGAGVGFSHVVSRSLRFSLGADPTELGIASQRIANGDLDFEVDLSTSNGQSVLVQIDAMRRQLKVRASQEKARHDAEMRAAEAESALRLAKVNAAVEEEKKVIYVAMVRASQHVLNNLLNQFQLFKLVADSSRDFDREILGLFDGVTKEASDLIGRLASVTELSGHAIEKSVAP